MTKLFLGAICAVILAGCEHRPTGQEFASRCLALGARPGTDAYVSCMVQLMTSYDQQEATIKAGILAHP